MKKLLSILIVVTLTLSLSAVAFAAPLIGVSQFGEHASLDNCYIGFKQGLEEAGLVEGTDYEIDFQNASFDGGIAAQIAQGFADRNAAIMVGIATPTAQACFNAAEEKDIPVIFTAVTDPVEAGLDEGNVTGTSDKLAVEDQMALIRALQPDATSIGIIYTTSEPGSVTSLAEYEAKAADYGFTIESVGITAQSEVTQAADTLIGKSVSCFSNLLDNTVVGVLPSILEKTDEAGIPVYGSEVEQVVKGCVASVGIDYIQLGKQTGAMAAKILKGEVASAADIPYETIAEYTNYVNYDALERFGIELPEDIADTVVEAVSTADAAE